MHSRLIGPTGAATAMPMLSDFQKSHASMEAAARDLRSRRLQCCTAYRSTLPCFLDLYVRRHLEQRLVRLASILIAQETHRVFVGGRFHRNLQRRVVGFY